MTSPSTTQSNTKIKLNIRFTTGETQVLEVDPTISIEQLKQLIYQNSENKQQFVNKYLRVIFHGKVVDDALTLTQCKMKSDDFVHCILMDTPPMSRIIQQRTEVLTSNDEQQPRGFERLAESGFSEDEIMNIRQQFYSSRQNIVQQIRSGEISDAQLREMEEQWMNDDHPQIVQQEQTQINYGQAWEGNSYHMFFGIILGFVFGLLTLVCLLEKSVPRKLKFGIVAGIGCNISFGVVKAFGPLLSVSH